MRKQEKKVAITAPQMIQVSAVVFIVTVMFVPLLLSLMFAVV
jgi:hypothetical protein